MSADEVATSSAPVLGASEKSKSKNGYYYWHGHGKDREAVGDVAPKPVPLKVATSADAFDAVASVKKVSLTSYSWCDNKLSVSVYVDFAGVDALEKDVDAAFGPRELRITVPKDGKQHTLVLCLAKVIDPEKCSLRFKPDQIVVKLAKASEESWFELTGTQTAEEN